MRRTYTLGKTDYNNSGRKNCLVTLEYEITERNGYPEFTMSGNVWNPRETDVYSCGQMCDQILKMFPHDKQAKRMVDVWKRWHLNGMKAGSPAQAAFLEANPVEYKYPESHFEKVGAALEAAGLNPDPDHIHNGKPYKYGSAWLREELPANVIAEVESWTYNNRP